MFKPPAASGKINCYPQSLNIVRYQEIPISQISYWSYVQMTTADITTIFLATPIQNGQLYKVIICQQLTHTGVFQNFAAPVFGKTILGKLFPKYFSHYFMYREKKKKSNDCDTEETM